MTESEYFKSNKFKEDFKESLWSIRLIGFSIGLIVFSIMTWVFSKEVLTMKHLICIGLAFLIIGIQTFVK